MRGRCWLILIQREWRTREWTIYWFEPLGDYDYRWRATCAETARLICLGSKRSRISLSPWAFFFFFFFFSSSAFHRPLNWFLEFQPIAFVRHLCFRSFFSFSPSHSNVGISLPVGHRTSHLADEQTDRQAGRQTRERMRVRLSGTPSSSGHTPPLFLITNYLLSIPILHYAQITH